MKKKTEYVSIRIESELKEKLYAIAEAQDRSVSNLVYIIIREYIKENEEAAES